MMKSPLGGLLSKASWVITALASINQGLSAFGWNLLTSSFFQNNLSALHMPLMLLVGAAGVWSLVGFFLCGHCD